MPKNDYFPGAAIVQVLKTPASVDADGNTAGVDITDYKGEVEVIALLKSTAGTLPTMDLKIQDCDDSDLIGDITYTGTGNGTITEVEAGPDAVAEDFTVTFSNATTAAVVGSVTGSLGNATVGTKFTSPQINFLLTAGETAFVNTDAFTVAVTARTYADVVAFTQVLAVGSIQKKVINVDELGRFIRLNMNIGGTDTPAFIVGCVLYGMKN